MPRRRRRPRPGRRFAICAIALWASIDNDDSRDLDQLSVAEPHPDGRVTVLVAIADVDAAISAGTPIDDHARANTTSVYTAAAIFPMLPEKFSTDLSSLGEGQDRLAIVVSMTADPAGAIVDADVYRATVRNRAKLAYTSVAAWLQAMRRRRRARRGARTRRTAALRTASRS